MIVIGKPAQYAKMLRRKNNLKAAAAGAVALLAVALYLFIGTTTGLIGAVVCLAIASAAGYTARTSRIAAAKNTAGINAEMAVAKALRNSSFAMVSYGSLLAHGDCDVIVAGPQLAIVEVKHGRGHVRVEDGRLRDDRKPFGKDPIRQATGQAAAVRQLAGGFVDAVVCVTGMENRPFTYKNTVVCSAADLPQVLAGLPPRISKLQAATLTGQLRAQAT